jgi:diguanylate cyclase (GGDEF)-like protein
LRGGDVVARLGGDEFTVLLPGADSATAHNVAERLRDALVRPFELAQGEASISACIGIAVGPEDACEYKQLVRAADGAMYRAKRLGRDRCVRFEAA